MFGHSTTAIRGDLIFCETVRGSILVKVIKYKNFLVVRYQIIQNNINVRSVGSTKWQKWRTLVERSSKGKKSYIFNDISKSFAP